MKHKIVILSDVHLGTKDSKAKKLIDFLEENPTELLILNGDIVDGWALSRGSKWKKSHTEVISKLLKMSKKTKIVWIRGNHDEFIGDYTDSVFGNIELREDYIIEVAESKYFVFHGDIIDVFITKYKWIAKLGSVGYDLALWVNRWYNRWRTFRGLSYYSISQDIKQGVKSAVNYINDFESSAIMMAKKHGCQGVICGHIHQAADKNMESGHYLNTGDWVESMTALTIDKDDNINLVEYSRL
jgi:UDP-2,3-diacylglucosamine pyrophosphatase LpxH